MAWHYPLTFDPQRAFLPMCSVSLVPKSMGGWSGVGSGDPLILYPNKVFSPLCPCHDYYLKVFTSDKDWLLTLFLLLLPVQRANMRLTVNILIGAHITLVSGNENRRLGVNV